jgi:EmrB/QacA subfamily drug resistance transporter
MAMVSLPAALGPIIGPTLGGLILTWADWHWIFWVNVPFCLVGLALAWRFLPSDPSRGRPALDWVGLVLISPALVGMLFGLSNVSKDGGFSRTDVWLPVAAGIVLAVAFVLSQARRRTGTLIDIGLLRRRTVAASGAILFLSGAALYGSMLLLPLYFQIVRGTDVLTAALLLIPQGVGALLSRTIAGRLTDSLGARTVAIAGFIVMGVATIPFAVAGATTDTLWLMAALVVRGFGMGTLMIPMMSVAFVGLERDQVPHASIITRLAQQLGGAFGTALLAMILEATTNGASGISELAAGFDTAFWWAVGFTVVAVGVCITLPGRARPSATAAAPVVASTR